jgi:hypothetical protein
VDAADCARVVAIRAGKGMTQTAGAQRQRPARTQLTGEWVPRNGQTSYTRGGTAHRARLSAPHSFLECARGVQLIEWVRVADAEHTRGAG